MIIKKLHTPEGVKDYLPSECILKTKIENNVSKVFKSFGYVPVKSPTFEYSDVFDNKGSVSDQNLYRFVDRDGSILTLRSDMTPAIARIVATTYSDKKMPIRLSYIENLFRHTVNYQGKLNEFTQAGVELIGAHSISADVEVLVMAIKAILSSGVKNFKIDLGHSNFLKGVLEEMFLKLGLDGKVDFEPSQEKPFLHPGRQALIYVGGAYAGFIGQVHPEVCENYDMKCEAYVAGIDLPTVTEKATFDRRYEGVAKYPSVNRDLSLVMQKDVFVGSLEKVMKEKGGKLLESIQLFDVYEGSQIEEGYKSVAFSLVFRSPERSLEAAEINKIVDKILKELEKMGVELRA